MLPNYDKVTAKSCPVSHPGLAMCGPAGAQKGLRVWKTLIPKPGKSVFFFLRVLFCCGCGGAFFFCCGCGGAFFFFCCGCGGRVFFLLRVRGRVFFLLRVPWGRLFFFAAGAERFAVFSIFYYENLCFLKFSIGKPLSPLYLNRKTSFFSISEYDKPLFSLHLA